MEELPLLLVADAVLLPGTSMKIQLTTDTNVNTIQRHLLPRPLAAMGKELIVYPLQPGTSPDDVEPESCEGSIATAASVSSVSGTNWPRTSYVLLLTGVCRIQISRVAQEADSGAVVAVAKRLLHRDVDKKCLSKEASREMAEVKRETSRLLDAMGKIRGHPPASFPARLSRTLKELPDDGLLDLAASLGRASFAERKEVLEAVGLEDRIPAVLKLLRRYVRLLEEETGRTNGSDGKPAFGPAHKMPSAKKKMLQLFGAGGDDGEGTSDFEELQAKLNAAKLPPHASQVAKREFSRLQKMSSHSPEQPMLRTYLELVAELPWSNKSAEEEIPVDVKKAREVLERDHYAMDKVKRRILEHLAVRRLKNSLTGPILCFVGPPGVGKTSIGKSIASTLGRKFHRISLGGVSDQSEIRGHRRTYIGSMPGKIIQGFRTVGENNPVFLLDEVDKMSPGIQGDPSSALLEVLDPEQNSNFVDHYLNIPFDLSQTIFLATANSLRGIPAPLRDRMEVVEVPGYGPEEKEAIARAHLLPKQAERHGLSAVKGTAGTAKLELTDGALRKLVTGYTREAGVRGLERRLAAVCRAVALQVAEEEGGGKGSAEVRVVGEKEVEDILGKPAHRSRIHSRLGRPGVALGLAWTPVGGEVLVVEATKMAATSASTAGAGRNGDGGGKLILTGQLGDVMKESATIALNWIRAKWTEEDAMVQQDTGPSSRPLRSPPLSNLDVHLHFPAGSVGKDGPSAGLATAAALASLLAGRATRPGVALTGEVTLRGAVLPVGGVREKLLAALREDGVSEVVLPEENRADADEVAGKIKDGLKLHFVTSIEEALEIAFEEDALSSSLPFLTDVDVKKDDVGQSKL